MGINKLQKTNEEKQFLYEIGNELGNARRRKHLTQNKVAIKLNCSLSHISDIENGNASVTAYELVTLCKLYRISPMQILEPNSICFSGLDLLPKDERILLETLYQKLLESHRK